MCLEEQKKKKKKQRRREEKKIKTKILWHLWHQCWTMTRILNQSLIFSAGKIESKFTLFSSQIRWRQILSNDSICRWCVWCWRSWIWGKWNWHYKLKLKTLSLFLFLDSKRQLPQIQGTSHILSIPGKRKRKVRKPNWKSVLALNRELYITSIIQEAGLCNLSVTN